MLSKRGNTRRQKGNNTTYYYYKRRRLIPATNRKRKSEIGVQSSAGMEIPKTGAEKKRGFFLL